MILFSDLSQIELQQCVFEATRAFQITPPSVLDSTGPLFLSLDDLKSIKDESLIVDFRKIGDFQQRHIPGSILVIQQEYSLEFILDRKKAMNALYIVIIENDSETKVIVFQS